MSIGGGCCDLASNIAVPLKIVGAVELKQSGHGSVAQSEAPKVSSSGALTPMHALLPSLILMVTGVSDPLTYCPARVGDA